MMGLGMASAVGAAGSAGGGLLTSYLTGIWNRQNQEGLMRMSASLNRDYDTWQVKSLYPMQLKSALDNYDLERQLTAMRQEDYVANLRRALEMSGFNPLLAVGDVGGGSIQPLAMPDKSGNFSGSSSSSTVPVGNIVQDYMAMKTADAQLRVASASATEREAAAAAHGAQAAASLANAKKTLEEVPIAGKDNLWKYLIGITEKAGKDQSTLGPSWSQVFKNIRDYIKVMKYKVPKAIPRSSDVNSAKERKRKYEEIKRSINDTPELDWYRSELRE